MAGNAIYKSKGGGGRKYIPLKFISDDFLCKYEAHNMNFQMMEQYS